ncbi:MAG: zf-HC2 domain-containing protein [Polyangia bacterium]
MCPIEELEALVAGTLDDEAAERVRAHLAGCASCKEELAWLSTEAELMARRRAQQPSLSPALWDAIADRIQQPAAPSIAPQAAPTPIRPRRWGLGARLAYGGLLAAAAAAVVVATWPGQMHNVPGDLGGRPAVAVHKKVSADVTLDKAEREYQEAAKVLEAEYQAERNRLPPSVAERYDRMISTTRTQVADARATAGNDVDGRMVVLDGYAEYIRNLQNIVSDIR